MATLRVRAAARGWWAWAYDHEEAVDDEVKAREAWPACLSEHDVKRHGDRRVDGQGGHGPVPNEQCIRRWVDHIVAPAEVVERLH